MNSHQQTEIDSGTTDSVTSTPRSDFHRLQDGAFTQQPHVRFMCSFGGKILPRPHDNQLRYVGGDTRIVGINRHATFVSLHNKLAKLSGMASLSIKYQLPNEDLDALITVTTDEDVENMMEEYDRLTLGQSKAARLRLFLFPTDADSRMSSISSLLDGSTRRENWFFDALNGGPSLGSTSGLERGKSEASSIVSEVPDYLFGLDNSDDPPRDLKWKVRNHLNENIPNSDPSSPVPVASSPFCSTSSALAASYLPVPPLPDLPPVKTKPVSPVPVVETKEIPVESVVETGEQFTPQPTGYPGTPPWHYVEDQHYSGQTVQPMPFYYVPTPVPSGNTAVQHLRIRAPFVQSYPAPPGQIPIGYRQPVQTAGQVYRGEVTPFGANAMDSYEMPRRIVADGVNQAMYYGVTNAGVVQPYQGKAKQGGEESGRVHPSS